jgi:exodeoxyribonuclease VII large subunit
VFDDVVGRAAAKLACIQEMLRETGLFERNMRLAAAAEFVRVAVISPETSAGLSDFQRESDRLQRVGLCGFVFPRATFQGIDARNAPTATRVPFNRCPAGPISAGPLPSTRRSRKTPRKS